MAAQPYKPSPRSRIRAFFFTDRMGQTLAASLGLLSIFVWWIGMRVKRLLRVAG